VLTLKISITQKGTPTLNVLKIIPIFNFLAEGSQKEIKISHQDFIKENKGTVTNDYTFANTLGKGKLFQ
jgi:hypothetical protein